MSRSEATLKSPSQVRCMFGLAKSLGLDNDLLHEVVETVTGKKSIKLLTVVEANRVNAHLQSKAEKQTPRRTVQHRRQRASINQVAQPAHIELMRGLARTRNMSDEGLEQLSTRIIKHYPPRTTAETNKVIEALKAMNRRDAL
jgi:hypothetical protein